MIDNKNTNIYYLCKERFSIEGNGSKQVLQVKTVTWMKDTHSLFDYEFTKNITKDEMKILLNPGFIFMYRNNPSTG